MNISSIIIITQNLLQNGLWILGAILLGTTSNIIAIWRKVQNSFFNLELLKIAETQISII